MTEPYLRFDRVNQRPIAGPPQAGNLGPLRRITHKFAAAGPAAAPDGTRRQPERPGRTGDAHSPEHGDSF
ncbi:MAG TPA: hypothetical protein VK453_07325 [Micromonosporaceae bacterium]|nr:hypothetical protein [Micromonosporaceae bacterium]